MARPFVITTASARAKLNKQGQGKVSFTVSNETNRPLKAQIKTKALNSAQEEWLTLIGESERDFPTAGSQQITVEIHVPPGTPSSKFDFRIDVASVYNPEEEYTEGPTVAFEAPENQPEKKKFPWWILAVVLGVLIIGGVITWMVARPKSIEVPKLEGLHIDKVESAIANDSFEFKVINKKITGEKSPGIILDQSPEVGSKASPGSTIKLVIEADWVKVPDFKGLTLMTARNKLRYYGLKLRENVRKTSGKVVDQKPKAGEYVAPESEITLVFK